MNMILEVQEAKFQLDQVLFDSEKDSLDTLT